jgi:hypothetical protein
MPIDQSEHERSLSCTNSNSDTAPLCPVCGGVLVPMRTAWRCSRCYFSLCAGCEPMFVSGPAAEH